MPGPPPDPPAADAMPPVEYAVPGRWPSIPVWLWAVVAMAVAVRIAFAFTRPVDPLALATLPDQQEYVAIADAVLHGRGIQFYDAFFDDTLRSYRMLGLPGLHRGVRRTAAAGAGRPALLLDGSVVLAVFLTGRRAGGQNVGSVAAVLVAVHPYLIYFSASLLSETLFTAMLAWAVWLLLRPSARARVAGVTVLLATVYVRPSAAGLGVSPRRGRSAAARRHCGGRPVPWPRRSPRSPCSGRCSSRGRPATRRSTAGGSG